MIMNAKQELLNIITSRNLTILKIEITYTHINWDDNTTITKNITTLDDLNFDYDAGYGIQELQGVIYCKDKNDNPVWLTRGEYDGSEWWNINTIPEFYTTNK